jgi:sulfur-carrier protein
VFTVLIPHIRHALSLPPETCYSCCPINPVILFILVSISWLKIENHALIRLATDPSVPKNHVIPENPGKIPPYLHPANEVCLTMETKSRYRIKAFGITKDIIGGKETVVEVEGRTVGELRQYLNSKYPQLNGLRSLFIAVNHHYAEDTLRLNDTDEIALIPPVSGG